MLDTIAEPQTLDSVQGCLTALWSKHSEIPEDVRSGVTLAAFEICSNIIEHAADGRPVRFPPFGGHPDRLGDARRERMHSWVRRERVTPRSSVPMLRVW